MSGSDKSTRLGALGVAMEHRAGGEIVVRSTVPMPPFPDKMTERLEHWARVAPERIFLAARDHASDAAGDWRRLSYGEVHARVRSIAGSLLARELAPERPIAILSGNGIEHALLALAAMYAGVAYAPISPAYALLSSDFGKLRHIAGRLSPQFVFADDAEPYRKAIAACFDRDVEVVAVRGTVPDRRTTPFADLLAGNAAGAVDAAQARVGRDTVAKILFTSGSTGMPKGVITTHGMLTANQAMIGHWLAFVAEEPPVLLDWLPWNHTFGGSHNFGLVLYNGGTLYIDEGKPTPAGMATTLANLRDVAPSLYFNVPKGYEELAAALRVDTALRDTFYSRLRLTFCAGASLPRHVSAAMEQLAVEAGRGRVPMVTGFGATETAPAVLGTMPGASGPGNIGLPLPGVRIKLVPASDKLEARVHAPAVMPGYWRDPEATARSFDAEGFYSFGDAFRLADPADPAGGFVFDGRITEDFKLSTGTWVSVGPLRQRAIAALAPLAREVVVAGHDRSEIGLLVFPDVEACRALLPNGGHGHCDVAVIASQGVRAAFADRLAELVRTSTGSSTRVVRIIVLDEPPSIDANEITDKGSINQRAVLARRAGVVEELFALPPSERVIAATA